MSCSICGTRTGQHGFSWDKDKWPVKEEERHSGILLIPESLVPDDEDDEHFVQVLIDSIKRTMEGRAFPPEIRIVKDEQ